MGCRILPNKHTEMSKSLFGIGGIILSMLNTPTYIETCWDNYIKDYIDKKIVKYNCTFDYFVFAIDYLYTIGAINIDKKGRLYREIN
ncbi:hypothetical protein J2Z76_002756 [Sedimentibacter acidaminivorans]|uniref:Uncharacterized protein n=1 Tax=Sedimentibacter acidaminivorans TaxID=913099 RepID=A0ABS4GGR1_9FIRM|nr:ABC-three component system middle component 6 [Sedimentibacter acidaminivorans]MBP1926886.1 hypothetical protein [Sedimentibacter acidaminivorans]